MELREIEIFLMLADELHFGRTAERLHVSQARVSQAISKQERQIGAPLFERTSRKVTLTPIGKQLLEELRPAYEKLRQAVDGAAALARGHEGTLTIGIMGAMGHEIAPILSLFRDRHPGSQLNIREAHFSDPFGPLRAGEIDIQLTWLPVREPDLTVGPIVLTEPRVLAVPANHPLADREEVSLEDLGDYAVMTISPPSLAPDYWVASMVPFFTPSGRPIPRAVTVTTFQEVLTLVATGAAITPVNAHVLRYYPRPDIRFPLIHDAPHNDWAFVWRTSAETKLIKAFAQAARDVVKAH